MRAVCRKMQVWGSVRRRTGRAGWGRVMNASTQSSHVWPRERSCRVECGSRVEKREVAACKRAAPLKPSIRTEGRIGVPSADWGNDGRGESARRFGSGRALGWPARGGDAMLTTPGEVCRGSGVCGAASHFLSIAAAFSPVTAACGGATLRFSRPSHERPQKKGWTRSVSPLDVLRPSRTSGSTCPQGRARRGGPAEEARAERSTRQHRGLARG